MISSRTLFSSSEEVAQRSVFHAIVSRNRAGLSAQFLEYVPLHMYFGVLSN